MPTGSVAPLQSLNRATVGSLSEMATPAQPAARSGDDFVGPVLGIGDDRRQLQLLDVTGDRLG